MQRSIAPVLGLLLFVWLVESLQAADPAKRAATGIEKRVPWTTSRVKGTPDPPPPYRVEPAFPNLKFFEPLELVSVPGTQRMAVAERPGKLRTFEVQRDVKETKLLLDVAQTVYGLAFHPEFQQNGYFYVTIMVAPNQDEGTHLVRFQADPKTLTADASTRKLLLTWASGGHNGGCLRFGPDGYLYIVTGDASGIADQRETGQDISDLFGSILRIDVDKASDGKPYAIPADNPFVKTPGARGEVYAYGVRQCWKISFDQPTKRLWAGEVGQDLWEMVYVIQKGGNYGWSVMEGSHPFRPERKKGPTPIIPPLVTHSHSEFRSITGGYVYHGTRLPALKDAYVYADYDTGKVWSLRYDGKQVSDQHELADTTTRWVCFGQDHAGELYLVDFIGGGIHRLVKAPPAAPSNFPRKLSETGLFASTQDHTPAAGLIPYDVNAPLWSDNAIKERFLALPGTSQIEYNAITYPQPAPGAPPGWRFPDGTVVVKTFSLELEPGNPASRRRLETRILHLEQTPGTQEVGDQVWNGYTYLWNDAQTDAVLLEGRDGKDVEYTIRDPQAPGGSRKQTWHFPSRAECTLCHTTPAKYVLGVNTLQLNKDHDYSGVVANQLATLAHLGIFKQPLPDQPEKLPHLVDYRDQKQSVEDRARSYLHANCSHCHMKWGGGNAEFQLLATLPIGETGTLGTPPAHGDFKLTKPAILSPGDPDRSMVLYRMKLLGLGRMPHIASSVVHEDAVKLIEEWIKGLPAGE